jgi:hypothetical protein
MDPAFYLYSDDFITYDLLRENMGDINSRFDMLKSLVTTTAIQSKQVKDELVNNGYDFNESKLISKADLDFMDEYVDKLGEATANLFENNTKSSIQDVEAFYSKTESQKVANEQLLHRIIYIREALWADVVATELNNVAGKIAKETKDVESGKGTPTSVAEYQKFMNDHIKDNLSLYDLIMVAGGIDKEYKGDKVDNIFKKYIKKATKSPTSIRQYYKNMPAMSDYVERIDELANIKIAYNTKNMGSKVLAQYAGYNADKRFLYNKAHELKKLMHMMYKMRISDQTGDPIRIYPTYKLYFIEEDAPHWGIYHDFYDYSAVKEITVRQSKEESSDHCIIKLSNITGKLTDPFSAHLPEIGSNNLPMSSMMLKPGTSILVKMGYSNNQVDLPIVFYGTIIEVNPGPIVEVIAQSYGAELTENVAPTGKKFGAFGTVKGLGDVVTWALDSMEGGKHLGRTGIYDIGKKDTYRDPKDAIGGFKGLMTKWFTGANLYQFNNPRDDNVYLPYNTANVTKDEGFLSNLWNSFKMRFSNPTFDWYIRNESVWDIIEEITWFQPDCIKTVLPYNDNIFPFIPDTRSTLYVGQRNGYYKYTDAYVIHDKSISKENVIEAVNKFKELSSDFIRDKLRKTADKKFGLPEKAHDPLNPLRTFAWSVYGQKLEQAITKGDTEDLQFFGDYTQFVNLVEFLDNPSNSTIIGKAVGYDLSTTLNSPIIGDDSWLKGALRRDQASMTDRKWKYQAVGELLTAYILNFFDSNRNQIKDIADVVNEMIGNDFGVMSLEYNREGNNPQYKKVQQHHIATTYTNIISNNIIATADGWANRVRLLTPQDPGEYVSVNEIPVEDREDLVETVFTLDDDITDSGIRTKNVFMNNIDPSELDDAGFATYAINASNPWMSQNKNSRAVIEDGDKMRYINKNDPNIKKPTKAYKDAKANAWERNKWRMMPSRYRIGRSILAKETELMYNGELLVTGNAYIKPYDIVHIVDYSNGMFGPVEVGEIIHTMSPEIGFTTKIKPNLIVRQKDKFDEQELFYIRKMVETASVITIPKYGIGALFGAAGASTGLLGLSSAIGTLTTAGTATILGIAGAGLLGVISAAGLLLGAGAILAFGYKALTYPTKQAVMTMNNTLTRDSLTLIPLTYKGMPYVAGIDGYRKDGPITHMYSMLSYKGAGDRLITSAFERFAYANAPYEAEYFTKYLNNSPLKAAIRTTIGFGDRVGPVESVRALSKALRGGIRGEPI